MVIFAGVSVWQAWDITEHFRREARDDSRIFGRIIAALNDPTPTGEAEVLLQLVTEIRATGLPVVVTDSTGRATAVANLPFEAPLDDPRILAFAASLDRINEPLTTASGGIHFGALPVARRLKVFAVFQLLLLAAALAVGVYAYRAAVNRDRDRLWVAMARESAHQLGTPLMSAGAWAERLLTLEDPRARQVGTYLAGDIERLQRVANRFERIGRPAKRESVALGALVERVATYFAPRLPRRSNPVLIDVHAPGAGPHVAGDPVLLEWALEALVRNGVDALSGRGGTVTVMVAASRDGAEVTVSDNGPGVPADLGSSIFEPGVSTKPGGWGIGLPLARRIIEEVHGGRLELRPSGRGATFVATLPGGGEPAPPPEPRAETPT